MIKVRNIFSTRNMVAAENLRGDIPPTREAYSTLIRLAMPSVAEMVLTSLVGSVDTMMVGKLGQAAIAAIGLTGQPRMLILSIFFAFNIGLTAVVSRRKGEGLKADANKTLKSALTVIFFMSIIMTTLAVIFTEKLMWLSGAIEGETLEYATDYFRIIIAAVPINALTMAINASQRGIGNAKTTLYVNIVNNGFNIVLNWLLIEGRFGFPRLEVKGAALASVIGMVAGFVMCIISLMRKNAYLRIDFKSSWKLDKEALLPVFRVGSNAVLEQVALRVGFFTFARIVASLGTDNFAVHQICMQFMNITFTFGDGIGIAGTSLVGQNLGRDRPDISMIYGKVAQRVALVTSIIIIAVLTTFQLPLIMLFTNEPHIIEQARQVLMIVALIQPFQTSAVVISGCLRGAGDTKFVAIIMLICITFIRPIASMFAIFVLHTGLVGAWLATLIDMTVRLTFVYIRFSSFKWATIKV